MHPVFSESFRFPMRHRSLGMRLHPLTIGHLLILHEAKSPLLGYPREITRDDLIYAVGICAQPFPSAADESEPGFFEWLRFEWVTWRWGRLIRKLDLATECDYFLAYLSFHRRYPDIRPAKGETRTLNSPSEWRLLVMLMSDFGLTWDEALNTPLLRAHALWATYGDREGWLDLWPNDPLSEARDKEFWEWAREEDQKAFRRN